MLEKENKWWRSGWGAIRPIVLEGKDEWSRILKSPSCQMACVCTTYTRLSVNSRGLFDVTESSLPEQRTKGLGGGGSKQGNGLRLRN